MSFAAGWSSLHAGHLHDVDTRWCLEDEMARGDSDVLLDVGCSCLGHAFPVAVIAGRLDQADTASASGTDSTLGVATEE